MEHLWWRVQRRGDSGGSTEGESRGGQGKVWFQVGDPVARRLAQDTGASAACFAATQMPSPFGVRCDLALAVCFFGFSVLSRLLPRCLGMDSF